MAVLITTDSIVKTVNPKGKNFGIDDLNKYVEGWKAPFQIGPVWVLSNETGSINKIASDVFDVALRGQVLVIPPQQLPNEWGFSPDEPYTAEEIDLGFLMSMQSILIYKTYIKDNENITEEEIDELMTALNSREEWIYDPNISEFNEELKEFFKSIYEFIDEFDETRIANCTLYEDEELIVQVKNTNDLLVAFKQMIEMYIEDEEYEKCARIQKIINIIEKQSI